MPQNSVNAIGEDRQGYIWLATENGLVRFDGVHFKLRSAEKPILRNNRFYYIFSEGDQLLAMNYDNEVVRIENGTVVPDTPAINRLRDNIRYSSGKDPADTGILFHIRGPNRVMYWDTKLRGLDLYLAGERSISYADGVITSSRKGKTEFTYPFDAKGGWNFFLLGETLYFLREDGQSVRFGSSMETAPLKGDILLDPGYRSNPANIKIFWNRLHSPRVLLYIDKTFYVVDADGGSLVTRRIFSGFDADVAAVNCGFYDEEKGRLYLGSSSQGLFILSEQRFFNRNAPTDFNSHYSIVALDGDRILSGTGFILGPKNAYKRIEKYEGGGFADFYTLSPDGSGGVWTKGFKKIYRFRPEPFEMLDSRTMPEKVTMLYTDKNNRLWIGLKEKQGVWTLDANTPGAQPQPLVNIKKDPTCFAEDGNLLYIGTDGGFYIYDRTNKKTDSIRGLEGKYVRSAKVSRPGEVWITTYEHGFFLYKNKKLTSFPLDDNKYLLNAHCIFEDHNGYFWITTNKGLFQARRQDLVDYAGDTTITPYYHYYDKNDGFANNEFNGGCQPCAAEMGNGYVSMPSLNGLVFFHPDSVRPLLPSAPVSLDGMLLEKKPLAPDSIIYLPESFNSFRLEFSCAYMGNRENLQLNYTLVRDGERDTVWIPLSDDGRVTFSTLPSGDYRLIVRKLNGFGLGNYSDKTVRLHVETPWYGSRYFYVLLLLLGIGATILITRLRTMYINRKNAMLEDLVASKTRELQVKSQLQEKIIQSVSHNILTPLKYQQLLAQKIYDSDGKETVNFSEMARVMNDHTHYLYHMVANLLKYLKSQMADRSTAVSEFAPAKTADDVLQIFVEIAREKNTVLVNEIPGDLLLYCDELLVSVMLYNLMDNAVKVTRNGTIRLEAREAGGGTALVISDSGPGIRADVLQWFNGNNLLDNPGKGDGIGLIIVKELAQAMGLHVAATTETGRGTGFTIWFPGKKEMH